MAEPKDSKETIPLTHLRQEPPDVYRLGAGDILGIYIEGILGEREQAPPVNISEGAEEAPSLGYPVPIQEDGTLTLPLIEPVSVKGMTLKEAQRVVIDAYTKTDIVKEGRERILVTLVRPRQTRVLVIRQDSPAGGIPIRRPGTVRSTREFRGGAERVIRLSNGTGTVVYLSAYHNDVLNALAQTGGLPGIDAANEIVIQRGAMDFDAVLGHETSIEPFVEDGTVVIPEFAADGDAQGQIIRIPLRLAKGEPLPFHPKDIILQDGDIVFIEARDTEVFYTGGLLPSGEFPLPRDYDLDVVEAVVQVGGPLVNGGVNSNNLSGAIVERGIGAPSPRLLTVLRPLDGGGRLPIIVDLHEALYDPEQNILVKPGDVLILQESKHQAVARYASDVLNGIFFVELFTRGGASATGTATVP